MKYLIALGVCLSVCGFCQAEKMSTWEMKWNCCRKEKSKCEQQPEYTKAVAVNCECGNGGCGCEDGESCPAN